jgi:hypothetical protein
MPLTSPLNKSFKGGLIEMEVAEEIKVLTSKEKQKIADKKYALHHPERLKAKEKKRYKENKESLLAKNKSYYMLNRDAQRIAHRNRRHRITSEWYDSQLIAQDNKCDICIKSFEKTPHIDHAHSCCDGIHSCDKCRRGLLCDDCNLGLGRFMDSPEILEQAIQYLKKYKEIMECRSMSLPASQP